MEEYDFYKSAKEPQQRDYRYNRYAKNNPNASYSREEFDKDYDDTISKSNAIANKHKKLFEQNGNQKIKVKPSEYDAISKEWDGPKNDFINKYRNGYDKYVYPSIEEHKGMHDYYEETTPEEYSDEWFDEYAKGYMRDSEYNNGYDWVKPYNSDDKWDYDTLKNNTQYIQPLAQLYNKVKGQGKWGDEDVDNWNKLKENYENNVVNPHWSRYNDDTYENRDKVSPYWNLYAKITSDDKYFKNKDDDFQPYTDKMKEEDDWNETKRWLGMEDYDDDEVNDELFNMDEDERIKFQLAKQGFSEPDDWED